MNNFANNGVQTQQGFGLPSILTQSPAFNNTNTGSPGNLVQTLQSYSPNANQTTLNPINIDQPIGVQGVGGAGASGSGFGLNAGTANLALSGLSAVGNLWAAFQAQKLAKKQFQYTKDVTDANLQNQIQTYNTAIRDRGNNRAIVEGRDQTYTDNYVDTNSLKKWNGGS